MSEMGGTNADANRRRLRRSSLLAGVGDGVLAVALALQVAGANGSPLAVAGVVVAYHLAWAVLAVTRPPVLGRADQRTILGLGITLRAGAVIVVGLLGVANLATATFLIGVAVVAGTGAALADGAEEQIERSARREVSGAGVGVGLWRPGLVGMGLIGLPLGGLAYEVAAALPFLVDVGVFALAALSVLAVGGPLTAIDPDGPLPLSGPRSIPSPVAGTGAAVVVATAATAATSAVLGVLVLVAIDDLGLGAPGYGLLLTGLAAAAAVGALVAPSIGVLVGLRAGAAVSLGLAGAGYVAAGVAADPRRPWVGSLALGVGAGGAMVASVLLRALVYAGAAGGGAGEEMAGLHARVWPAVPAGALVGGLVGMAFGVGPAVIAAGLALAVTSLAVALVPVAEPSLERSTEAVEVGARKRG